VAFSVEELEAKRHDRTDFDCGEELLNQYLRTLAGQHRAKGIATTFVLVDSHQVRQHCRYPLPLPEKILAAAGGQWTSAHNTSSFLPLAGDCYRVTKGPWSRS
jgi:hypothetical protein